MTIEYVHDTFRIVGQKSASDLAISFGSRQVTYDEIELASNKLANLIVDLGAKKGDKVIVMSSKPVETIIAMISILKSGCVFVPIDYTTPQKKIEHMLSEVTPEWFIVDSNVVHIVHPIAERVCPGVKMICVDRSLDDAVLQIESLYMQEYATYDDSVYRPVDIHPDDMCYIYFTSGSTGQPKGIMGRIKSIGHYIDWEIKTFGIGSGTRVSQLINPAFDAYLRDIFAPLCAGGTICIPEDREIIFDARRLIQWLQTEKVNLVHCVPSLFRSLLNEPLSHENFQDLGYVLLAGEMLLPTDVQRWNDIFGERIQLVNLYGPSETTMTKFCYFVQDADRYRRFVPIGKPIPGSQAIILDENGNVCPPGIVGEIYIRTPFRSLGYYNRPDLTSTVFVRNPFSEDPKDIVYKTGDLGRLLDDGDFEVLGRRDQQVKIRGVRIELSEVEDALRSYALVTDVAVVDREDSNGTKYLCAYITLRIDTDLSDLRAHLAQELLLAMIPSAFIVMQELPRTISGKIDRRALPLPGRAYAGLGVAFVAPTTPIEQRLAELWSQILMIRPVGINDDFFALGGHSLLATQLLSRVYNIFQVELPLHCLFETPTITGLATAIEVRLLAKVEQLTEAEADASLSV